MLAYKAFDKDLKCRGVQYEVGHIFYEDCEKLIPCEAGIHCCPQLKDVFNYYDASESTRVCEVKVIGEFVKEGDKLACREIEIIRELSLDEIKSLTDNYKFNSGNYNSGNYNSGYRNSGYRNSGYRNSGYCNSGDCNSGNYNSGYCNSGDCNSGDYNSGNYNSGYCNSGYRNSGYCNSGDCNSGDYNSGNYNSGYCNSGSYESGFFNSNEPTVRMFNKDTGKKLNDLSIHSVINIISKYWKDHITWVNSSSMSEEEKKDHPEHETIGGYLKQEEYNYKKSWGHVWAKCSKEEKQKFLDLPNFDAEVFKEITGIDLGPLED